MPNHLSILGIIHTAISILAILAGLFALLRDGKIDPANYAQIIIMSTTLFISLIPAIVETLTRLPMEHPLASGPNDPIIQIGKIILGVIFLSGLTYQLLKAKPK